MSAVQYVISPTEFREFWYDSDWMDEHYKGCTIEDHAPLYINEHSRQRQWRTEHLTRSDMGEIHDPDGFVCPTYEAFMRWRERDADVTVEVSVPKERLAVLMGLLNTLSETDPDLERVLSIIAPRLGMVLVERFPPEGSETQLWALADPETEDERTWPPPMDGKPLEALAITTLRSYADLLEARGAE